MKELIIRLPTNCELNCNTNISLKDYIYQRLQDEFNKCINVTYKDTFDNSEIKRFELVNISSLEYCKKIFISQKKFIDYIDKHEYLVKHTLMFLDVETAPYNYTDGNVHISRLVVYMRTDRINEIILNNLSNIDGVIDFLTLCLHHEVGHMIRYVEIDNSPIEKYNAIKIRYREQQDYFSQKRFDNYVDLYNAYFAIDEERKANENVKITTSDLCKARSILNL